MKLGGSLRRNRKKGGKRKGRSSSEGWGKTLLYAGGLAVVGWGGGYLMATRFLFPAPPPPSDVVRVPDTRGMRLAEAQSQVRSVGLTLGRVDTLSHPNVAAGEVLGQSPLPGQLLLPNGEVRMTVSRGPQRRAVPDVLSLDGERARIVLETTGFFVRIDSVESRAGRGRVVSLTPDVETVVILPTEVLLRVSTGPPVVLMPLVLGLEEDEAIARLDSLGLFVGEVTEVFRFGRDQGIVIDQEPAADSELERGATVRLSVGRRGGRRR